MVVLFGFLRNLHKMKPIPSTLLGQETADRLIIGPKRTYYYYSTKRTKYKTNS